MTKKKKLIQTKLTDFIFLDNFKKVVNSSLENKFLLLEKRFFELEKKINYVLKILNMQKISVTPLSTEVKIPPNTLKPIPSTSLEGYGDLHKELLRELKEKLKSKKN